MLSALSPACQIGDTLYICKTCGSDFNAPTSLCETCFNAEDAEHRELHSFFSVFTRFVSGLPDDKAQQAPQLYSVRHADIDSIPQTTRYH